MSANGRPECESRRAKHGHGQPIVVIGGGWAGCAAAVELARSGHAVELHEAAAMLGGRARCVPRDGLPLDNGQHLLLGAYADTLALAAAVGDDDTRSAWTRGPIAIRPFAKTQRNGLSFVARDLPGAWGLLVALLRARELGWRERGAAIRWFARQRRRGYRCDRHATVAMLLAGVPARVREALWEPLCVAALNTPPARASGQLFLDVLREALGAGARASAIVAPGEGLGAAIPEPTARWLAAGGHAVRTSSRTRVVAVDASGVALESGGGVARADAVVVAVAPQQLAATFAGALARDDAGIAAALADVARFEYEPVTTAYLGYAAPLALPGGLLRLDDAPGQWLFDRADILRRAERGAPRPGIRALVSVVISAGGRDRAPGHRALVAAIDAQLRRLAPGFPTPCWSQVIEEKRATYACVPALVRPRCGRLAQRIYLCGDYTYPTLPATLEGAVRSGITAARALTRDHPA